MRKISLTLKDEDTFMRKEIGAVDVVSGVVLPAADYRSVAPQFMKSRVKAQFCPDVNTLLAAAKTATDPLFFKACTRLLNLADIGTEVRRRKRSRGIATTNSANDVR